MGFQKISRISIRIGIWVPRVLSGVLRAYLFDIADVEWPGYHGCGSIKGKREKFPKRKEKKRKGGIS